MTAATPDDAAWRAAHAEAITDQRARLERALGALIDRAALPAERLRARPAGGGWTGAEVLEHVARMHRFVLVLIEKVAARSRARLARGERWPTAPPGLDVVAGLAASERRWSHPAHMTPTGVLAPAEAAERIARDRARLLELLDALPSGEGTLHRIRMSAIEGDDRLDLYQWIELVVQHAERHARQIDRIRG